MEYLSPHTIAKMGNTNGYQKNENVKTKYTESRDNPNTSNWGKNPIQIMKKYVSY